jgi:hypothetical protein
MSYSYESEKAALFTEENQKNFLKVRDFCQRMLKEAGAVRADKAMAAWGGGSSWTMLAAMDRLVEIGELREITSNTWGQHRVFVDASESR